MNKITRTTLTLAASAVLLSAVSMAQAGGNANKDKAKDNKEHHSRLAKVAFWRHKDPNKNVKPAETQTSKPAHAKTAQLKPASAEVSTGKSDQKPAQHTGSTSKPAVKKAPAATKTEQQHKTQEPKTASLKQ
jgi:hypothetical protein